LTLLDHNYWNLGQARYVLDNRDGEEYAITPLFVSVTASFQLTDHDGHPCAPLQKEDYQCPSLIPPWFFPINGSPRKKSACHR